VAIIKRIIIFLKNLCVAAWNGFDIRDFFVFGGLCFMGYGLWCFRPWIGLSVTGLSLMILGLFAGKIK
jgi:hypothetical protein